LYTGTVIVTDGHDPASYACSLLVRIALTAQSSNG